VYPDDVFKATVHRAINRTGVERYSIPLFFGTDYDVLLEVRFPSIAPHVLRSKESIHSESHSHSLRASLSRGPQNTNRSLRETL
jgi:isopenicillin N synthase-like dioxygenase